jgi:lipopolysaccharide transport system permease protein
MTPSPDNLPLTIYTPESSLARPGKMLKEMFADLLAARELAWRLAVRDISAQYRQTFLGFLWALIVPLANTLVWVFLSASGMVRIADTGIPYPVYVFTGTMLWGILMDALNAPLQGAQAAKAMLAKINFPREALIVSGIYQTLFNAGIKLALLLIVLISMGYTPGWQGLLIPVGVFSLILTGTVLGVLVTPVGLLYGDIGKGIPLIAQFLMYLTPVVFPMPQEGMAKTLLSLNPLTPIIVTARDWLTGQPPEFLVSFMVINAVLIAFLLAVWAIYRLAMPILIERMSA